MEHVGTIVYERFSFVLHYYVHLDIRRTILDVWEASTPLFRPAFVHAKVMLTAHVKKGWTELGSLFGRPSARM